MKKKSYFFLLILSICCWACQPDKEVSLTSGMTIDRSVTIRQDTFYLDGDSTQSQIKIEGENITIDFNGSLIIGSDNPTGPDLFQGVAIEVLGGKNITIKNARVRGFKVGLLAEGVDSLRLLDADFSYNYRQRLKSTREKEDLADWMSYHENEQDEWLRYGMAVYLKSCDHALVKNLKVTGGQNGLMLKNCQQGLFYNNDLSFNSGLGIGMYRCSGNRIMHNKLDWNIRGYSHGVYNRGQDSAGILLYEQCSDNIITYNSATHSGDGFFLWAGQSTMDSGEGGCNDNLVFDNDFSYASNNGIEVTFSGGNKFYNNKLYGCDYGIWGGYSYGMDIAGNIFKDNRFGIAIEHGNRTHIRYNQFDSDKTGIKLFEREKQPEGWNFAKVRDVSSRAYQISHNFFENLPQVFSITNTDSLEIRDNYFFKSGLSSGNLLDQNTRLDQSIAKGEQSLQQVKQKNLSAIRTELKHDLPPIMPDGVNPFLDDKQLQGRQYMIMDQYGPYNFKYPGLFLREVKGSTYTFALFGPFGNWKAVGGEGFERMSQKRGSLPATLVLNAQPDADQLSIELEFVGESFIDAFGVEQKKGKPVRLSWKQ